MITAYYCNGKIFDTLGEAKKEGKEYMRDVSIVSIGQRDIRIQIKNDVLIYQYDYANNKLIRINTAKVAKRMLTE